MLKQIHFIYLLIFFIGGCSQMETKAPLIPMEDFMRNPEKSSFPNFSKWQLCCIYETLENQNERVRYGYEY